MLSIFDKSTINDYYWRLLKLDPGSRGMQKSQDEKTRSLKIDVTRNSDWHHLKKSLFTFPFFAAPSLDLFLSSSSGSVLWKTRSTNSTLHSSVVTAYFMKSPILIQPSLSLSLAASSSRLGAAIGSQVVTKFEERKSNTLLPYLFPTFNLILCLICFVFRQKKVFLLLELSLLSIFCGKGWLRLRDIQPSLVGDVLSHLLQTKD